MHITVDVNVNAPELSSAILRLAGAMSATTPLTPAVSSFGHGDQTESKSEFTFKLQEAKNETPAAETTVTETVIPPTEPEPEKALDPTPDPVKTEPTPDPAPVATLEQVRGKLAGLSQSGKQAEVKALITKFGVNKLTDIPKENYPELLAAAEAIA